ncbi:MAG: type II toxin-antitoxin system VapC family toxin [Terriglobales bacterium]
MSKVVLDASAILALLNAEPGTEMLTSEILSDSTCSTVNLAEVQSKLVSLGGTAEEAWDDALSPVRESTSFTEQHAKIVGNLVAQTRTLGLSLGDRACLALATALDAPVYTADKSWKKLKLDLKIYVIR